MIREIIFFRHGEAGVADKDEDRRLTQNGVRQVEEARKRAGIPEGTIAFFHSPTERTRETAVVLGGSSEIVLQPVTALSLHEWPGDWDSAQDVFVDHGNLSLEEFLLMFGSESPQMEAVRKISTEAWTAIRDRIKAQTGTAVVVGHAVSLPALALFGGMNLSREARGRLLGIVLEEAGYFSLSLRDEGSEWHLTSPS